MQGSSSTPQLSFSLTRMAASQARAYAISSIFESLKLPIIHSA